MAKSSVYLRRHKLKLLMFLLVCAGVCYLLILVLNTTSSSNSVTGENNRYVMVLPFSKTEEKALKDSAEDDKLSLLTLYEFLDVMVDFDGQHVYSR